MQELYAPFESDTHRQICGVLASPKTVIRIITYFNRGTHLVGTSQDEVGEVLKDLEADGLVKNIGEHEDPHTAWDVIVKDKDLKLDEGTYDIWAGRARVKAQHGYLMGDLWLMTTRGFEALTTPPQEEEE